MWTPVKTEALSCESCYNRLIVGVPKPHHGPIRLVEDDPEIRGAVKDLLEEEGYHVYEAEHGRAALDLLAHCEEPCVMLVDLMMPVMDGWALVSALRADSKLSRIPV